MRAQASVAPVDENATFSRRLGVVDTIFDTDTSGGAGRAKLCGVVVLADAADVKDTGGREDVLGATGSILSCTAGDEGVFAGDYLGVEGHVFLFGKDGIIGFEAVLGKERFVAVDVVSDRLFRVAVGEFEEVGSEAYSSAWISVHCGQQE